MPVYDVEPWDAMSDYTVSFRNYLEGFRRTPDGGRLPAEMHNRVHNWVGGSMSEGSSPNDPVFFLHHAFIDLLWSQWLARYGQVYLPVSGARFYQNLHDPLWAFPEVTPAMLLDHQALGYIYDRELSAFG
jgi:tyrosinase